MAPARRPSRKTGATSTPPVSTPAPAPQLVKQTPLKFAKVTKRAQSTPAVRLREDFLDPPAGIRTLIYKQVFPRDKPDIYAIKGSLHKAEHVHHVAGDHLSILTTRCIIYIEAEPILYDNTEFCTHI